MNKSTSISTEVLRGDVVITKGAVGVLNEGNFFDGYPARVLWDTGATTSAISKELAAKLKIDYLRDHDVETAHGGKTTLSGYSGVSFMLMEKTAVTPHVTDVVDLTEQSMDAIVGMDIISLGKMTLEPTEEGGTRFTFTL